MKNFIKNICTAIISEYIKTLNIESMVEVQVKDFISDAIRELSIRKKITEQIEEEMQKSVKFWNSGSTETRTVVKDIVSSEILKAIRHILTNSVTLADIEKMKPETIKNLLSKR